MSDIARPSIPRLLIGFGLACLAAWFLAGHRDEVLSVRHGLAASSPWSWLQALTLSVALAVATGGVARHALAMTRVSVPLPDATRLTLSSTFLCAVIPSCGMAGAALFASRAARASNQPSAGAAGYFMACIVGRLGLELAVLLSLPLLRSSGIPLALVMAALAVHALSTVSKVAVVGASRRHEGTLVRWIASVRSLARPSAPRAASCPARQLVEQFASIRWRDNNFRSALTWSMVGKMIGGLMLVVAAKAAGGTLGWEAGLTIYAAATIVGSVSFLPAGLGAADLTIGHALVVTGMSPTQATTAVVFYRVFQLWLPLVAGGMFAARSRRTHRADARATSSRQVATVSCSMPKPLSPRNSIVTEPFVGTATVTLTSAQAALSNVAPLLGRSRIATDADVVRVVRTQLGDVLSGERRVLGSVDRAAAFEPPSPPGGPGPA